MLAIGETRAKLTELILLGGGREMERILVTMEYIIISHG